MIWKVAKSGTAHLFASRFRWETFCGLLMPDPINGEMRSRCKRCLRVLKARIPQPPRPRTRQK